MKPARYCALAGALALCAFYGYVGALAARPQVSLLYRMHYIDKTLRHWNHGKGPEYRLGETIDFGRDQAHLSRRGWSEREDAGTWSDGRSAEIHLRIVDARRPRQLAIDVVPFIVADKGISSQILAVYANDLPLGVRTLAAAQELCFEIPDAAMTGFDGMLRLRFEFANAASPKQLGLSRDRRLLGIRAVRLTVS